MNVLLRPETIEVLKLASRKLELLSASMLMSLAVASCSTLQIPPSRQAAPSAETIAPARFTLPAAATWQKLETVAFRGKQDDIFFLNPELGWYVNGGGKIYKTINGGSVWREVLSKPGTFFRTIAFVDETLGFAGNIGTDYFPGVTDTTPLYVTRDGGETWSVAENVSGPAVKGLCAIDVLHTQFINAGELEKRTVIHAAGRVGGPAFLMRSLDGGKRWTTTDLSAHTKMILDLKFFSDREGFVMGASDDDVEKSNAIILKTTDGGATWKRVFQSKRPFELTWKASFPTRNTGYVTIQNYNPDKTVSERFVAKTVDGGESWSEIALVNQHEVRQFGVAFADERTGWVGTTNGGYQTEDGGASWKYVDMGRAVNKIRVITDAATRSPTVAYAIGVDVRKISLSP